MKCKPNNLHFLEQSQLGKRLVYHDEHPVDVMMGDGFFSNVVHSRKSGLRAGDFLTLMFVKYQNADRNDIEEVLDFKDVVVSKVSKTGELSFFGAERLADSAELVVKWNISTKTHDVLSGEEVLKSFKSKDEATAYLGAA